MNFLSAQVESSAFQFAGKKKSFALSGCKELQNVGGKFLNCLAIEMHWNQVAVGEKLQFFVDLQ